MRKFLEKVIAGGPVSVAGLTEAESSTYVTLSDKAAYSSYFWSLVISAIIATAGIAANSSAVVVGAMLISPIMSPIIGSMLAAMRGNKRATLRTLLMTFAAAVVGIGVSLAVVAIIPVPIDLSSNAQVSSRTAPGLIDLLVAFASGIIAAIALVRDDIPTAIPGVAIAVSLMPPLSVVGVALYACDWEGALGAFLLFMTNYFAIQIACLIIFLALGVATKERTQHEKKSRVAWYASVAIGLVIISIPLALTSADIAKENEDQRKVHDIAHEWLAGSTYELDDIKIENDDLTVTIAGTGEEPSLEALKDSLTDHGVSMDQLGVIILEEKKISCAA